MSGLSQERLREIEERVEAGTHKSQFIAHARTDVPDLLAEVKRLTAKNARLRSGIEAIAHALGPALPAAELGVVWAATDTARRMARDLLNPTEGETHHPVQAH